MFSAVKNTIKNMLGRGDNLSAIFDFGSSPKRYTKKDSLTAYQTSLYANRAITKRAEKVGDIQFVLKKGDKVLEDNETLNLLNKPNAFFSGAEFWRLYQKYMDIYGEVYIWKQGERQMGGKYKIDNLHFFPSDRVTPIFNKKTGELQTIKVQEGGEEKEVKGEQIIYIKNPNPANPTRGESLLMSGLRQIDTATEIDTYQNMTLRNGGRVEGIFSIKESQTANQIEEARDKYKLRYAEAQKAGLPMFVSGNVEYKRLGLSPAELAYIETKEMLLNDIVILTGVPKAVLGLTSAETFANADASIKIFLREVIKPLMQVLVSALQDNMIEEGITLEFIDPTPEDREEKRKDIESGIKNYYLTPNEARQSAGYDPIDGGDSLLAPMNIIPLQTEVKEPEKEVKKESITNSVSHPLQSKDMRRIYHSLCLNRLNNEAVIFEKLINSYFKGQEKRITGKLKTQTSALADFFDTKVEVTLAVDTFLPALTELLKKSAETAKEMSGSEWEFNETAEIQSWLENKTEIFAEQINNTTFKKLKDVFADSAMDGDDRDVLIKKIQATYGDISKARAGTIARTETHGVMQYGTMEGYKQAGMSIKIWVWAPGTKGGIRDNHQSMDGEEKPLGTAFSNGVMFPGDGPAGEVINCACFI